MKKTLLITIVLVAASATAAAAGGFNLTWGDRCSLDGNVDNLTWACDGDTNASLRLTCTFALPQTRTNFVAADLYLLGCAGNEWSGTYNNPPAGPVPDWWRLDSGGCRSDAVTFSHDGSVTSCLEPSSAGGEEGGGIGLYSTEGDRVRLNATWAFANPITVHQDEETFAGQFRFDAAKTVGTGACGGCTTQFVWHLLYIAVSYQGELVQDILGQEIPGGQAWVLWQQGLVPARNKTWGQIKSLYR